MAPDVFELRLDALVNCIPQAERAIAKLKKPLITTARHPREGGLNRLSDERRRDLLQRFLPHANYIDVELQSIRAMQTLIEEAKRAKCRLILSLHDFDATPRLTTLRARHAAAIRAGADIFKVAARTDNLAQLQRLIDFVSEARGAVVAMGIGRLATASRMLFALAGSPFTYAAIGTPLVEGQVNVATMRGALSSLGLR
jgi:3-dehydroquinate dehydratase type I